MIFRKLSQIFQSYNKKDILLTKLLAATLTLSVFVLSIVTFVYKYKIDNKPTEYTEGIISEYQGINPLFPQINKANDDISYLVFEGLTRYNPATFQFEDNLATFQINENSTVFTFDLKENLKWSDGEEITIDDILFTYKQIYQNNNFPNQIIANYFQEIQITNTAERQIQFKLPQPNSFFLAQATLPILPSHKHKKTQIEDLTLDYFEKEQLTGSGPFQIKKIESIKNGTTRVLLKPNPHWRKDLPDIKQIEFLINPTPEKLINLQDNINSFPDLNTDSTDQLDQKIFTFQEYTKAQYTALFLNNDNTTLRKQPIRNAIQAATDKSNLQNTFPNKQVVSLPIFQFQNLTQIPNANLENVITSLENLGYSRNSEGIFENENQKLEFTLTAPSYENNQTKSSEIEELANFLKQNYSNVGIKINLQFLPNAQFSQILSTKNYDMILLGQDLGKDFDLFPYWHSSQTGEGRYNLSNYQNPITDALLEKIRTTNNQNEQRSLVEDINNQIYQDTPAIFLYTDIHVFAFDNKVKNRNILTNYSSSPQRFFNIESWSIN
jgi:peptide/nickel transport system substrate-binding protein